MGFLSHWDSFLVYFATLAGVLVAQYLPSFKSGTDFDLSIRLGNLAVASVIAMMFVLQDETSAGVRSPSDNRAGKKKNLRRRLGHGIAQGIAWTTITN